MRQTTLLILFFGWSALLFSTAPAQTQPTTQPLSVPEQLAKWQDEFDQAAPEQMLPDYAAHTDQERAIAKDFADNAVACNRLILHARQKFGAPVEMAVAHATWSDCRDDDKAATFKVDGDHADVAFRSDSIDDLFMVRENGQWKIDVAAYEKQMGKDLDYTVRLTRIATRIVRQADADLADGKYESGYALITDLTNKLNDAQTEAQQQPAKSKTIRP